MTGISVVIATYNRAEMLRACLDALTRQTPSEGFEIVVAIDGSTDGSRDVALSFADRVPMRIHEQANSGVGTARNRGAELASAPYLLFLDDDIVADPNLVAAHLRAQREHGGIVGLGRLIDRLPKGADGFARAIEHSITEHYARLERGDPPPDFMDCYSGNLSVPRDMFMQVGGFAVDLPRSEDVELGYRLHRAGLRFAYLPAALARQDYDKGFRAIAADTEKAGIAAVELYRRHPAMLPHMHLAEFCTSGTRMRLARRLLLAVDPPLPLLAGLSRLADRSPRRQSWYRLLQSYLYWRGVRAAVPTRDLWRRLTDGTRILMYHAIGAPGEPAGRFLIPARRFERHMRWIERRGYRVLGFEEYLRIRREGCLPPPRSVLLTFDDGYADFGRQGRPVLRRLGYPATLFLVSGAVGARNLWDADGELAGRPTLSWPEIEELQENGAVACGAHTRSHVALTAVPALTRREEIAGSLADLRERLETVLPVFSYPFGMSDAAVQADVGDAGFDAACGIEPGLNGPNTPLLALRRTEIFGTDGLLRFAYALWRGRRPEQMAARRSR